MNRKILLLTVVLTGLFLLWGNPVSVAAKTQLPSLTALPPCVEEQYSKVPWEIRDTFERMGWTVSVVDHEWLCRLNTMGTLAGYDTTGVTHLGAEAIYLSDKGKHACDDINHEIGHFLDVVILGDLYGINASADPVFIDIYFDECEYSDMDPYFIQDSLEYFAEAFKEYVESPRILRMLCPRTYRYIDDAVYSYAEQYRTGEVTVIPRSRIEITYGIPAAQGVFYPDNSGVFDRGNEGVFFFGSRSTGTHGTGTRYGQGAVFGPGAEGVFYR